ncbi:MAG: hypothetical protein VYA82_09390 [Pseudomonadota bacterium]|nr:hypothetical protein [Pseudomonadota bacterium]
MSAFRFLFYVAAALLMGGCDTSEQDTLLEAQAFLDQWLQPSGDESGEIT